MDMLRNGNVLNCTLSVHVQQVACIRGRLASQQPVFVRVSALGDGQSTRALPVLFPLHYDQMLVFRQTFSSFGDPAALHVRMQGERFQLEVLQLSSSQTGCRCIATCDTRIGDMLGALQRPRRLSNGSLSVSCGDLHLTSSTAAAPTATTAADSKVMLVLRYAMDLTILQCPNSDPVRPLIDLPSTVQVSDVAGTAPAGCRTKLDEPLQLFWSSTANSTDDNDSNNTDSGDARSTPVPSAACNNGDAAATAANAGPHCHECCPRRGGGDTAGELATPAHLPPSASAAAARASASSVRPTPMVAQAMAGFATAQSRHRRRRHHDDQPAAAAVAGTALIPSLSPFAPRRPLTHCPLPRTVTGLSGAVPLEQSCISHCGAPSATASTAAAPPSDRRQPFAVRRVAPDLLQRRNFCSAGTDVRGASTHASVEFVDHPSRPSYHHRQPHHHHHHHRNQRRSSPTRTSVVPGELDRSPLKPTRSQARSRTVSGTTRRSLDTVAPSYPGHGPPLATANANALDSVAQQRTQQHSHCEDQRHERNVAGSLRTSPAARTTQLSDRSILQSHRSTQLPPGGLSHSGHVRFAAPAADGGFSDSGSSSVVIGPITVTTSPPSSTGESPASMPTPMLSPPLSPDHFFDDRTRFDGRALGYEGTLRRMQQCGDEVKKLSTELQTRIDSLLSNFCPGEQEKVETPGKAGMESASADLQELRSSLHSARQERLRHHQTPTVERPVRIADSTYWTQQLGQYTGQSNRQLFDETLEKAYADLYQRAAKTR